MQDPVDQADLEDQGDPVHDLVLAHGPALVDHRVRVDLADHGLDREAHHPQRAKLRGRSAHLPRDVDAAGNSIRRRRKAR
jgi:hypothetical protein